MFNYTFNDHFVGVHSDLVNQVILNREVRLFPSLSCINFGFLLPGGSENLSLLKFGFIALNYIIRVSSNFSVCNFNFRLGVL